MDRVFRRELDYISGSFNSCLVAVVFWACKACIVLPYLPLNFLLRVIIFTLVTHFVFRVHKIVIWLCLDATPWRRLLEGVGR